VTLLHLRAWGSITDSSECGSVIEAIVLNFSRLIKKKIMVKIVDEHQLDREYKFKNFLEKLSATIQA
jgi:hypothetical protein